MKKLKYLQPNHENRFPNVKSGTMVLELSSVSDIVENEYPISQCKGCYSQFDSVSAELLSDLDCWSDDGGCSAAEGPLLEGFLN